MMRHLAHQAVNFFKPRNHLKLKFKHKETHSHTGTQTVDKKETLHGDDVHSGVTDWSTVVKVRLPPKRPKIEWNSGKNLYVEEYGGFVTGQAGLNTIGDIVTIGSVDQWLYGVGPSATIFGGNKGFTPLIGFQANQTNTGGAFYGSVPQPASDKLFLSACNVKVGLCNMTSTSCTAWVYVFESLQNQENSPRDQWNRLTAADTLGRTFSAQPGAGLEAGGTIGYVNIGSLGITPNMTPDFKRAYKTLKVHRVNLAAGAQEDMDFMVKINQLGDVAKYIAQNPLLTPSPATWVVGNIQNSYQRGCVSMLIVAKGQIVDDNTVANVVSTAAVRLGVTVLKEHIFKNVVASQDKFNLAAQSVQIGSGAALANQKTINIVDANAPQVQA